MSVCALCKTPTECDTAGACKIHFGVTLAGGATASPTSDVYTTLAERGSRYGDFTDNALVSQSIKEEFWKHPGWPKLDLVKRETLEMIAQKIARILNGDPEYRDNWHDIAGYAKLAENRCFVRKDKK